MKLRNNIHIVKIWFLANAVAALFPPVHWVVNDLNAYILGLPASLLYFLVVSFSIMLSIIYAYRTDVATGNI